MERSPPQTAPLPGNLHRDLVTLLLRSEPGWRLARQFQSQLLDEQLVVRGRLGVARQNQPPLIDSRDPHVDHLDFRQLFQYRHGRQPWGVQQETLLEGHLQAVGEKGKENVRVGAMLQLMVDGADAEFALERSKNRFDLGELNVAGPQEI